MEFLLARLAVYDLSDLLRHTKSVLSYSLRTVFGTPGLLLAILLGLICYFVASKFSRKPVSISKAQITTEEPINPSVSDALIESQFISLLKNWILIYKVSKKEIYSLWLHSLNEELSEQNDAFSLLIHSVELEPTVSLKTVHFHSTSLHEMNSSEIISLVSFPLMALRCRLKHGKQASVHTVINVIDFKSKMRTVFSHKSDEFHNFRSVMLPNSEFILVSDDKDVDVLYIKKVLMKAINDSRVEWKSPLSSFGSFFTENRGSWVTGDEDRQHIRNEEITQSRSYTQRPHTPIVESPLPMESHHSLSQTPPIPMESVHSAVRQNTPHPDSAGPSRNQSITDHTPPTLCNTHPYAPSATSIATTASTVSDLVCPETPVILAYNARVRQSITARQLPRPLPPHHARLIRSASYYGESSSAAGSFSHSRAEDSDGESSIERDLVGDFVPVLPTSTSVDLKLNTPSHPHHSHHRDVDLVTTGGSNPRLAQQQQPSQQWSLDLTSPYEVDPRQLEEWQTMGKTHVTDGLLPKRDGDAGAAGGESAGFLTCKKLLIKVVKAEGLNVKSPSNAYCVVELDEPYQRHSTHCSSAGQLFWDQHLLFDLNTNSNRINFEVFELSKRKKSVSKGRSELPLSSLLGGGGGLVQEESMTSITSNTPDISEFRRRLPLICRTNSPLTAPTSSGSSMTMNIAISGTVIQGHPTTMCVDNQSPTITAEFHFMEKVNEDSMTGAASRLRPNAVKRAHSTRGGQQSFSAQDSPILGMAPAVLGSPGLSHSTSLEFPNCQYVSPRNACITVAATATSTSVGQEPYPPPSVIVTSMGHQGKLGSMTPNDDDPPSPGMAVAPFLSPVPQRRALLDERHTPTEGPPRSPLAIDRRTTERQYDWTDNDGTELTPTSPTSFGMPTVTIGFDAGMKNESAAFRHKHGELCDIATPQSPDHHVQQPPDTLLKRSTVIGVDESNGGPSPGGPGAIGTTSRLLLPMPDADFDLNGRQSDANDPDQTISHCISPLLHPSHSAGLVGAASSRSPSLASRLRTSFRGGKRTNSSSTEHIGAVHSLALLGPSRQLAGMAASISTLPTDAGTSPISAAALASAVAVAGATGSWQSRGDANAEPPSVSTDDEVQTQTFTDPPLHQLPPAASVAAASPGTYTAQNQSRRSDVSNLSLFRLFRHKKKRFRSVGADKLLYLEHGDLEDFDVISNEGYYRILQDAESPDVDR